MSSYDSDMRADMQITQAITLIFIRQLFSTGIWLEILSRQGMDIKADIPPFSGDMCEDFAD